MAFSPDQIDDINRMVANAIAGALAARQSTEPERRDDDRRKIKGKCYEKVDKFTGKDGWKKFNRQFMIATKMVDEGTEEVLKMVTMLKEETDVAKLVLMPNFNGDGEKMKRRSVEIYDVLVYLCEGEASQVVDSVETMDGFTTWQRLHDAFNKMTTAKTMRKVMGVVAPPKVTDIKNMLSFVEDWEAKARELKAETGDAIPERFMSAILTCMCPVSVQEWVFQQTTDDTSF